MYGIRRFTDYYPDGKAQQATYSDVLRYIEYLRKNFDLHPKSLRNFFHSVKIYFNWLIETGRRSDHPCSELNLKDQINKQIQTENLYSPQALERYFETADSSKLPQHFNSRNKVIASLLIYQALTVTEIAELTTGEVNLEKGEISIKAQFHQLARTFPLKAKQILLFDGYLKNDRPTLSAFAKTASTAFILGRSGEKITPFAINMMLNGHRPEHERMQPQKIRQSVIANLLDERHDTRIVQVFAGHRRASTTEQYRKTGNETLQEAVERHHPVK
jgi:integrase/recombinase XerD